MKFLKDLMINDQIPQRFSTNFSQKQVNLERVSCCGQIEQIKSDRWIAICKKLTKREDFYEFLSKNWNFLRFLISPIVLKFGLQIEIRILCL